MSNNNNNNNRASVAKTRVSKARVSKARSSKDRSSKAKHEFKVSLIGAFIQGKYPNTWRCLDMKQRVMLETLLQNKHNKTLSHDFVDEIRVKGRGKPFYVFYKMVDKPKMTKNVGKLKIVEVDKEGNPKEGREPLMIQFVLLEEHEGYTLPPRKTRKTRTTRVSKRASTK
jgi:hypothetical protein